MGINEVILMGRITATPELKETNTGISVLSFTLAVNRPKPKGKDAETDFITIVVWRSTAEFISKYFVKGQQIGIVGSIRTRMYEDKTGSKRQVVEVIADKVTFAGDKKVASNAEENTTDGWEEVDWNLPS